MRSIPAVLFVLLAGLAPGCENSPQPPARSQDMSKEPVRQSASAAPGQPTAPASPPAASAPGEPAKAPPVAARELATFGAGCFWCVEAVLEQLDGVLEVHSGYMGGKQANPTYEQVCTGLTGHAEVTQIAFDPTRISYEKLLGWFWKLHDPTTLNRQGNDVGTQYRSAIFYHSEEQRAAAEKSKASAQASGAFRNPIVTEITAAGPFYEAEKYHQGYYQRNRAQPYCQYVITPKLEKLGLEK